MPEKMEMMDNRKTRSVWEDPGIAIRISRAMPYKAIRPVLSDSFSWFWPMGLSQVSGIHGNGEQIPGQVFLFL